MSNFKRVFLETMFSKRVEISRKRLNRFTWNLEGLIYTKKVVFNVADFFKESLFFLQLKNDQFLS